MRSSDMRHQINVFGKDHETNKIWPLYNPGMSHIGDFSAPTRRSTKKLTMRKVILVVAVAAAFGGLSACASFGGGGGPRILSANEAGITYQVRSTKVSTTESAARAYCEARGRTSALDRVTPVGNDANVSYFCR